MVDYNKLNRDPSKISTSLNAQINEIMGQKGRADKIDHHKEYAQLQELLNGGKYKGDNKEYIEGLMIDYEDQYETSKSIREKVLDIVGKDKKVDDENEKHQLENLKKGADGFDKEYIERVIDGKEAVDVDPDQDLALNKIIIDEGAKDEDKNSDVAENLPKVPVDILKPSEEDNLKPLPHNPVNDDTNAVPLPYEPKGGDEPKPVPLPFVPPVNNTRIDNSINNDNSQKVQQNGEVNIIADDITINIGEKALAESGKVGKEPEESGEIKEDKPLTTDEKVFARKTGKDVYDLLSGPNMLDATRVQVKDKLLKDVNSRNIREFLTGYLQAKGRGDGFFEQLRTEWGFDETQNLMHKVAEYMRDYLKDVAPELASRVDSLLAESVFKKDHAKELDKIAVQLAAGFNK